MSQHTPGPWRVHEPSPEQTTQILATGGLRVADVWATDLPGGMENARLIAKAPEMYDMLSDLVGILGDYIYYGKKMRALLREIKEG